MLGAIVGDIVGSRFEFNNIKRTDFDLFHRDCTFTDDTICTIAVADYMLHKREPLDKVMRSWCLKYHSSYGGMFLRWIHDDMMGPYNSFGNGSAMRVSPVAWIDNVSLEHVLCNAELTALFTHNHPEGIKGAVCIADLIYSIKHNLSKASVKEYIEQKYRYDLSQSCNWIRETNSFNETCQITVPQAIQCFIESEDFESAIRLAVSIGGDSDTIAAITGSLAEAYYGIPEWITTRAMQYLPKDMKDIINEFKTR